MMNTITVKTSVLRWAMDRSGKTVQEMQEKFPKLAEWLRGEGGPTLRQLEGVAQATTTPLGFFFLDAPMVDRLPVPDYRTIKGRVSHPSPDLLDTIYMMESRQDWMRNNLIEEGHTRLPFVRSVKIGESSESIASKIRRVLAFDEEWASRFRTWTEALKHLRESMEKVGILVVVNGIVGNNTHRKLDVEEFRGFVLADDYAPLVFVNGADGKAAQMFTLAHELAHVFFGISAAFDLHQMMPASEREEQACNIVAAEFLVPERILRKVWNSVKDNAEPFQVLAGRFKVSTIVVARRALDLKMITKEDFIDFYNAYVADERRKSEQATGGGDFYAVQSQRVSARFAGAVVRATKEGRLLYKDAYALTGLHGKTFETFSQQFN